jgi:hypothetical protein
MRGGPDGRAGDWKGGGEMYVCIPQLKLKLKLYITYYTILYYTFTFTENNMI